MAESPTGWTTFLALPGVGRKTANIVLGNGFGQQTIGVDTHVMRLSQRLGLTKNTNPDKIEYDAHAAGAGKGARTVLPSSAMPRTARLRGQEPAVS